MLPNRIGGARGPNGTTLDDLLLALEANTTAIQSLVSSQTTQGEALAAILTGINAIATAQTGLSAQLGALALSTGNPSDTTCDMSQLELLCAIATALGLETTSPLPDAPAFRCGNLFQGEFIYSTDWIQAVDFPLSGGSESAAYYAVWSTPPAAMETGIETQVLPETGTPIPLLRSLNPGRLSVCMSATVDANISHFYWRRYSVSTLAALNESGFGTVSDSEIWTEGATLTVDVSWYYVIFAVVNTIGQAPSSAVRLFYTEGAVG